MNRLEREAVQAYVDAVHDLERAQGIHHTVIASRAVEQAYQAVEPLLAWVPDDEARTSVYYKLMVQPVPDDDEWSWVDAGCGYVTTEAQTAAEMVNWQPQYGRRVVRVTETVIDERKLSTGDDE